MKKNKNLMNDCTRESVFDVVPLHHNADWSVRAREWTGEKNNTLSSLIIYFVGCLILVYYNLLAFCFSLRIIQLCIEYWKLENGKREIYWHMSFGARIRVANAYFYEFFSFRIQNVDSSKLTDFFSFLYR